MALSKETIVRVLEEGVREEASEIIPSLCCEYDCYFEVLGLLPGRKWLFCCATFKFNVEQMVLSGDLPLRWTMSWSFM